MQEFKDGDKVYLKEEEQYTNKRIWEIQPGKTETGRFILVRILKGLKFIEFADSNELVKVDKGENNV